MGDERGGQPASEHLEDGVGREPAAVQGAVPAKSGQDASRLPPLRVSKALVAWGRALVAIGLVLLALVVVGLVRVLVALSLSAWVVDLMIVISGLPVVVAMLWIVGRAMRSASDGFVRGVTTTYLVALAPPARPAALSTPLAVLRTLRLLPALLWLGVVAVLAAGGDWLVAGMPDSTLRIGATAVTCDGLAALAALALALGWGVRGLGRAIAAREQAAGAGYYALEAPPEAADAGTWRIAICAVPGQG